MLRSFVLGKLSLATMPWSCNCMKINEIQFYNCLPKLVHCSQEEQYGVVTQDGLSKVLISKIVRFQHMCGAFRFWSNFRWPKIWVNQWWSPHHIALSCYTWLILVINCNNEVCSCSNNTVSKAFWQKKVLPKQRISCCGVIYNAVPPGSTGCGWQKPELSAVISPFGIAVQKADWGLKEISETENTWYFDILINEINVESLIHKTIWKMFKEIWQKRDKVDCESHILLKIISFCVPNRVVLDFSCPRARTFLVPVNCHFSKS